MVDVKKTEAEAKNNAGSGAALMRTIGGSSGKKSPVKQAFQLRRQTLPPHRHQQHHMLASYQIA